ncbi:MAG: murein biosynthesis integral membrane protein MurJ [Myxococcales bacterium]|nr:murein biosynthesis integral membrane protein MurJ [Myxococcales bacterium]
MQAPAGGQSRGERVTVVAALLAVSVLLSRVLGLVRDRVLAHQIGATAATDAYGAAFLVPDILNYFLAGGALSIAFIPLYTRVRTQAGAPAAHALFARVLGTMSALAVAATVVLWWQAEPLVLRAFPRFAPETQALTVRLTRIVLPAQVFFVAGGIVRAVLMAEGRFASQALAPVVYNLGIIVGGALFGATLGAEGFAWGALAGAAVGPFAIPVFELWHRMGLRPRLRFAPFDRDVVRYLGLAAPLMLGVTLLTVDEWYDKVFGGLLAEGTLASLGYARRLMQVPVAVVGQAIATAALPMLARLWSEGRRDELDRGVLEALRAGLGLAVLAAAAFYAFAEPIVALIIQTGRFSAADTVRVATLLAIFAWAVPAWITQQIAVRAFYARGQMWRPMLLGTGVALAAIPLYLVLGRRFGGEGLAAAGVIGMSLNALLTLGLARVLHGGPSLLRLAATGARAAVVGVAAAAAGVWVMPGEPGGFGALCDLALGGAMFAIVTIPGVWLLGDQAMREALRRPLRRLRRAP